MVPVSKCANFHSLVKVAPERARVVNPRRACAAMGYGSRFCVSVCVCVRGVGEGGAGGAVAPLLLMDQF